MSLLFSMIFGCSSTPSIDYLDQEVTPFSLLDVNTTSALYDSIVNSDQFVTESPEKVSAWYFGHST